MAGIPGSGCGGPIGNKNALGNEGGRPCKFNKELELREFLEWAKNDDSLVLRMFAPYRGYSHQTLELWAKENDEFLEIFNMAKTLVGARRELRLIDANNSKPFDRYATYYDDSLHEHEKRDLEHKAKVSSEIEDSQNNEVSITVKRDRHRDKVSTESISTENS